jgi:CBS domain containing-hemolysin-like protein
VSEGELQGVGTSLVGLVGVGLLVLANAYFVATEFALVAVRRSQLKLWVRANKPGASSAMKAVERLDDAIAATQLGITLASLGLGWIGEPALASLLHPPLASLGLGDMRFVHSVAVAISFAIITFLHVVLGELAPKALALDRPGPVALACAAPLLVFGRVFRPALSVMNGAGNLVVRLFGVKRMPDAHATHSPEELSLLVEESRESGAIRADTGRLLGNVFRMARTRVRDVMIPRDRIFAVERRAPIEPLLDEVREQGYTRIPVCDGGLDKVIGLVHAKDLFHLYADKRLFVLDDLLRKVPEMPPDVSVLEALRRFRRTRTHLAVVRDPDGPLLGLVTLEDVLEEIVGEIEDEHDVPTAAGVE